MRWLEVHDVQDGVLAFDLADLVELLRDIVDACEWSLGFVDASGPRAEELHQLSDVRACVGGAHLRAIAAGITQVIDGDFIGRDRSGRLLLQLKAVDSSLWVVGAAEDSVASLVRSRFADVRENPRWGAGASLTPS
ncbi:MAG: hypothetical protein FJ091_11885 [Deltaproteobacteria bacterium]|nr:hypothetical protein [Deltaproteobacteria bacterium]